MLKATLANNLMKYRLRPISALGLDCSAIPENFNFLTAQEEFSKERSYVSEAKEYLSRTWAAMEEEDSGIQDIHDSEIVPECVMQAGRHELEIVFLGTGSSQPSKYRNVSGIYLHLFERGGILLDCGEGTYAQLKRRYGSDGADDILRNLKCIWISHIHADHHAGLPRLLSARKRLIVDKPLLVIGPKQLRGFLNAYEMVEELGMVFLDCSQTTIAAEAAAKPLEMDRCTMSGGDESLSNLPSEAVARSESDKLMQENGIHLQQGVDIAGRRILNCILRSMGLRNLRSVHVVHCHNAYGIVLESDPIPMDDGSLREGWKVVYSGDTRPCPALVDASKGATVLIHEATFDDSKPMEAIAKNHSITKEAIEVGMTAGVYRIILTHFSQRYPKIPVLSGSYTNKTCIAFDMMSVNIADLPLLPRLLPAFKMLFQDEMSLEDEDDQESYVPDSADSLLF
ncbi:hypothetical protein KP509_27G032400 [Ceratopteris richardii]|nr:hypothetical protein KP509_27G032400 [Ceratopteris richardii]